MRFICSSNVNLLLSRLNGPNTGIDWTLEGRRTIPLLPRLKARSAFTTLANSLSFTTAIANERKPDRRNTVRQSGNSSDLLNDNCNDDLFKLYYLKTYIKCMCVYVYNIYMCIIFVLAAETESHPNVKMEEDLSIGTKLNSFENELDNSKTLQEVSKNIINLLIAIF